MTQSLRMPNAQFATCVTTASDIMKLSCFNIMNEFKHSLQEHQKSIKQKEAKKERLIVGSSGMQRKPADSSSTSSIQFGSTASGSTADTMSKGDNGPKRRHNVRSRVNIKPTKHYTGYDGSHSQMSNGSSGSAMQMSQLDPAMASRSTAIEQIEVALNDVASLFKKFGTIVQQHQTLVERIDSNAEQSLYDIEGAKKELRQVYEDTSNNRKLMLKIFFILLVFSTFYILFVL